MTTPPPAIVLAAAFAVRLVPLLSLQPMTGDVLRYHKVAAHVLDRSWNPYQAPRLYPYPPVWVWFEAASGALARRTGLSFPVLVKLPVLAADLGIVVVLLRWPSAAAAAGAWVYALHPVGILVGAFHGQFDAIALLLVLLALRWLEAGRHDASALALAGAIAVKSFPVLLLLPLLLGLGPGLRRRARYALLALGPVALSIVPYALHDVAAVRAELLGYGGVADFGWIGLYRGAVWLWSGVLARSEAVHWSGAILASKLLFAAGYAALLGALARRALRWPPPAVALGVLLAFLTLYGAVSAQYLLWVVPLAALAPDRRLLAYTAAATVALVGFYLFFDPAVLTGEIGSRPVDLVLAGRVWVAGVAAVWVSSVAWTVSLVRQGLR